VHSAGPDEFDPLDYPWSGTAADPTELSTDGRTLVVAVGSNASPAVLARKLADVDPIVPTSPCVVTGIAVGHSAHVSARGYIPAAPYAAAGVETALHAGWFTPDQLRALDDTEPNYDRITLSTARFPIEPPAEHFDIYRSHWGVLAENGTPLGLLGQRELFAMLASLGAPTEEPDMLRSWWSEHGFVAADGI
jgi:hypothetical protein